MNKNSSEAGEQHSPGERVEPLISREQGFKAELLTVGRVTCADSYNVECEFDTTCGPQLLVLKASRREGNDPVSVILGDGNKILRAVNAYDDLVSTLELISERSSDKASRQVARMALAGATKPDTSDESGSVQDSGA